MEQESVSFATITTPPLTPKDQEQSHGTANLHPDIGNALIAAEAIRRAAKQGRTFSVTIHKRGYLQVSYTMSHPE